MPATAGRVRMPANNRVHSSAALQTHGIWQSAIGYDPYAPNKNDSKVSSQDVSSNAEPDANNAYDSFQGLLALARITNSNTDEVRGACKKCGRVGHLTFQCRNFLSIKEDNKEKDPEAIQAAALSELDKIKGASKNRVQNKDESEEEGEEEDESETSDSEIDSEMERIIAERHGRKKGGKARSSRTNKDDSDDNFSDSDVGRSKKRGRSKNRSKKMVSGSDSEDEDERRRKRKEKRRKRDDSSEEEDRWRHHRRKGRKEKRRRRSRRYSDDSDSDISDGSGKKHKRKSKRADADVRFSEDLRVGRGTKRSEKGKKHHRHHHHEDDN